jgi:hypothetical protein
MGSPYAAVPSKTCFLFLARSLEAKEVGYTTGMESEGKKKISEEVRGRTVSYLTAAFGLIVGLAWNEAVKALIESIFPTGGGLIAKFVYAIGLTVVLVLVTTYLLRSGSDTTT